MLLGSTRLRAVDEVGEPKYVQCTAVLKLALNHRSKVRWRYFISVARLTMIRKAIGCIVGTFFILEVFGMLMSIGTYFTHDFSGVYFFPFRLSLTPPTATGRPKIRYMMPPYTYNRYPVPGARD